MKSRKLSDKKVMPEAKNSVVVASDSKGKNSKTPSIEVIAMRSQLTSMDAASRRRLFVEQRKNLSEYAVTLPNQPSDVSGTHTKNDKFQFFSRGREFQPSKSKHHFTDDEWRVLETYESAAVLPSHSEVYCHWIENSKRESDLETWLVIGLIAVIIGTLSFIMRAVTEKFQIFYNPFMIDFNERGEHVSLWLCYVALSCAFSALSAAIVIFICPYSTCSGVPEIIGILNGCIVRNILSLQTLVCKIISCVFTVISKLPVGFEGPMIHIGANVAAMMARPAHCSCNCKTFTSDDEQPIEATHCCQKCTSKACRYRDCQERHALIAMGAAAGIASAFSSPITGLTFSMEEMSSHWSDRLTWQTFVCSILARSTTELLQSIFITLEHPDSERGFSTLQLSESALFDMKEILELNLVIIIPAACIGVLGGLLGSLFIFLHLKLAKFRRMVITSIHSPIYQKLAKLAEAVILAAVCATIVMGIMPIVDCNPVSISEPVTTEHGENHVVIRSYKCEIPLNISYVHGEITQKGYYHEGASLFFESFDQLVRNLLSRKTADLFGIPTLLAAFIFFFIFSNYASMVHVASGLLIPMLAIGALYGRIVGKGMHDLLKDKFDQNDPIQGDWLDPGIFALLGAASFLSGTSRLPITSVVLLIEITNDINMAMLIMIVVMVSKFVGDLFTHPLYHSLLEFKCIPYLDSELRIYHKGKRVNLELFRASDVMSSPVCCVHEKESIQTVANILLGTNHGAFPVVRDCNGLNKTLMGTISRLELVILLTKTNDFELTELEREDIDRIRISYPEYSSNKVTDLVRTNQVLNDYSANPEYKNVYVNMLPYMNTSVHSVPARFSLYRAYIMFRSLGLRHLVVTDCLNQVVGIITRKDLLGHIVESRVAMIMTQSKRKNGTVVYCLLAIINNAFKTCPSKL